MVVRKCTQHLILMLIHIMNPKLSISLFQDHKAQMVMMDHKEIVDQMVKMEKKAMMDHKVIQVPLAQRVILEHKVEEDQEVIKAM